MTQKYSSPRQYIKYFLSGIINIYTRIKRWSSHISPVPHSLSLRSVQIQIQIQKFYFSKYIILKNHITWIWDTQVPILWNVMDCWCRGNFVWYHDHETGMIFVVQLSSLKKLFTFHIFNNIAIFLRPLYSYQRSQRPYQFDIRSLTLLKRC